MYAHSTKGCDPLDATNVSKHLIDQSEDRISQINQSKNALKQKMLGCIQKRNRSVSFCI